MLGYEKLAWIDLTRGQVEYEYLEEKTARKYLGGVGVGAKIIWDETTANTEPFSPESPLIFMTGPLTGTLFPLSSRHVVAGLSPLTGIWGQATSGGSWADELRRAGLHGVVLNGVSEDPVYLWIHDSTVEIRDARHLWGKDTYVTSGLLKNETDAAASVACIGRAGENLVPLASIMNDGSLGRAAARCGLGAAMGFKKLKAIVARGSLRLCLYDVEKIKQVAKRIHSSKPIGKLQDSIDHHVGLFERNFEIGNLPFKNWREGTFDSGTKLFQELRKARPHACRHCGYGCAESYLTSDNERHMVAEAWGPIGTNCLIDDPQAVQQAYTLCNKYGMDTISVGGVIGFAMECFEKGLITKQDTGGIDLTWGNADAMLQTVESIGEANGFGTVLGMGVRHASQMIGGRAVEYAMHVKGLEFPIHDPRAGMTMALGMSTGSIGATHMEATGAASMENYFEDFNLGAPDIGYSVRSTRFTPYGKGELVAKAQNVGNLLDSLVVCNFIILYGRADRLDILDCLNAATGWDMDLDEVMVAGERIFNLKRMINVRRGISRKDDTLPPRFLTQKRPSGGAAGSLPFLGLMLNEYYTSRGWSEEGIPTRDKLRELDLDSPELITMGMK